MMQKVCNDQSEDATKNEDDVSQDDGLEISYSTDLKNADYDFVIEVFRDLMLFSIVKKYKERHRYNIRQIMQMNAISQRQKEEPVTK